MCVCVCEAIGFLCVFLCDVCAWYGVSVLMAHGKYKNDYNTAQLSRIIIPFSHPSPSFFSQGPNDKGGGEGSCICTKGPLCQAVSHL